MNVTVYVNGKRVTKEEMEKIEIRKESAKRIFMEVLGRNREVMRNEQRNFI